MTPDDRDLFVNLIFSHKRLFIAFQEIRRLKEFPNDDPELVHERFCDAAEEVYQSLEAALLEGRPLQDALRTVLLATNIALAEGKQT